METTNVTPHDHQLIADIYHAAIDPSRWTEIFDRAAACVGSKGVALIGLKTGKNSYISQHSNSHFSEKPELSNEYLEKFSQHDNDSVAALEAPCGTIVLDRYSERGFNINDRPDLLFLKEHFGVFNRFGVKLNDDVGLYDLLTFQYAEHRGGATAEELEQFNFLRPHLAQTLVHSRIFAELYSNYNAVLSELDKVHRAMMLVDARGHIVVANAVAKELIIESDVIGISTAGTIKTQNKDTSSSLINSIQLMSQTSTGEGLHARNLIVLPRANGASKCLAEISPIQDTKNEIDHRFQGAMITITDPDFRSAIDLEGLDLVYGLSQSESAVAALVVDGLSNTEIAEHRNVSPETIKTQVRSIYSKSSATNRADFIRRVLNFNLPVARK